MTGPSISLILPVRNQADHIERIVEEYEEELKRIGRDHEVLLVVNASRDGSEEVCRRLAAGHKSRKVLMSPSAGWGLAVRTGLSAAEGDLLCYTNSARTHPKDLSLMMFYALAYPDTVIKANRKIRESFLRRLGSLIYNLECRALFDLPYWDINGTPKVFPRQFRALLSLTQDGDLIDLEFHAVCRREEYPMLEVPILSVRRHGGRSTTNLASAARLYVGALRMARAMRGRPSA